MNSCRILRLLWGGGGITYTPCGWHAPLDDHVSPRASVFSTVIPGRRSVLDTTCVNLCLGWAGLLNFEQSGSVSV